MTPLDSVTCVALVIAWIVRSPAIPGPVTIIPTRSPETLLSVTVVPAADVTVFVSSGVVRLAAPSMTPEVLKSNRSWMFDLPAQVARSTRACRHEPELSKSSCTD